MKAGDRDSCGFEVDLRRIDWIHPFPKWFTERTNLRPSIYNYLLLKHGLVMSIGGNDFFYQHCEVTVPRQDF